MKVEKLKNVIVFLAALLLLAGSIYIHFLAGNAGDKDWLLIAARMWLGGKKLYIDIFESNPPLVIWLYSIPARLSILSGFQDYHILVLLGLCITAFVIFIATKIVLFHPEFIDNAQRRMQFACLLVFVFIFYTSPAYFFDREHMFLVLSFPYVLRWAPSTACAKFPLTLRLIIGSLAAIGFCLKPHFLIIFVGIQLITLWRERSWRILVSIENTIIYAGGSLYLWAVWWFTPEYISVVLPMAAATYASYNNRDNALLYIPVALFGMALTFVDFRLRYRTPYRREIGYFLQMCALLLLYALISNGWGYTYNLLISGMLIVTGWVFWDFLYLQKEYAAQRLPIKSFVFGARACVINFAIYSTSVVVLGFSALIADCNQYDECLLDNDLLKVVQESHANSFGALALKFHQWPALTRASGATLETRFNHLWMMPKFVDSDANFSRKHQWILEYVANALAGDLDHRTPDLVFVDNSPFFIKEKHADLIDYFEAFPDFKHAWQHYNYLQTIDRCTQGGSSKLSYKRACKFDIYRRVP